MYTTIYTQITAQLTALGFTNVGPAFGKTPKLPAAQVWLGEDKLLDNQPVEHRELTWIIQLTIAHSDTAGVAQTKVHTLLDTLRQGFYRWKPADARGYNGGAGISMIKVTDYELGGSVIYLAALSIRAFPGKFA